VNKVLLIILFGVVGFCSENIHTTFFCEFRNYANQKGSFSDDALDFTIVTNDNNDTFTMKGNNGTSGGTTIRGEKGLSFVEVTETGNIATTTMVISEPYGGKQQAAHSRNMLVNGKLLASQYYGTCQLIRGSQTKKVKLNISTEMKFRVYKELKIEKRLKTLSLNDKKYILEALEGTMPSREEMKKYMSIKGMMLCAEIPNVVLKNYDKKSKDKFDSLYDSMDGIIKMLDKPKSAYEKYMAILRKEIDIDKRLKEITPYDRKLIKDMLNGATGSRENFDRMSKKGKRLVVEIGDILMPKIKK